MGGKRKHGVPRKIHYVPQFYLKGWAYRGSQIWVYDKFSDKSYSHSVGDLAQQKDFHTGHPLVERGFTAIENFHVPVLERVIALKVGQIISPPDMTWLAHMISFQDRRTQKGRDLAEAILRKGAQEISDELVRRNHPPERWHLAPIVSFTEGYERDVHLLKVIDPNSHREAVNVLPRRTWTLWVNRSPRPFITSDHPVSVQRFDGRPDTIGLGILSPWADIAYPLSPRHLLVVTNAPNFDLGSNGQVQEIDPERISYYNTLQVVSGRRQVYSNVNDFGWAKSLCDRNPILRRDEKAQVTVETITSVDQRTFMLTRVLRRHSGTESQDA